MIVEIIHVLFNKSAFTGLKDGYLSAIGSTQSHIVISSWSM